MNNFRSWLTWKRLFILGGLMGLLASGLALTKSSGLECGTYVLGRWTQPYFTVVMVVAGISAVLIILGVALTEARARSLGQGLLVSGGSLVVMLIVIEITLRFTNPPTVLNPKEMFANHDVLGYTYAPRTQIEINSPPLNEYRQLNYTDAQGFLIFEKDHTFNPNAHRIMFIGDSLLAGMQTPPEANLSVLVRQQMEAATGETYQSFNYGVSGYSPLHYKLVYDIYGEETDAETVIALFYAGNDFTDITRYVHGDRVIFDEGGEAVAIKPQKDYERGVIWKPEGGEKSFDEVQQLVPEAVWHQGLAATLNHMVLAPMCRELTWENFEPTTYDVDNLPLGDVADHSNAPCRDLSGALTEICVSYPIREEFLIRNNPDAIYKEHYTDFDREDIDLVLDTLRTLKRQVNADGRRFILVIVPLHHQIADQGEGMKPAHGLQPGTMIESTAPQDILLNEFCVEADVTCVDLLPAFRAHSDEQLFWFFDFHFTIRGQALAAEEIIRVLQTP